MYYPFAMLRSAFVISSSTLPASLIFATARF
jgi:hypothetical protein